MPSNFPERRQHRLKPASGATRARIVAAKLLDELFLAVHDALATLHACLAQGTPAGAVATAKCRSPTPTEPFSTTVSPASLSSSTMSRTAMWPWR